MIKQDLSKKERKTGNRYTGRHTCITFSHDFFPEVLDKHSLLAGLLTRSTLNAFPSDRGL